MKGLRGAGLTDNEAPMPSKDALDKVNYPHAKEHTAHISGNNSTARHTTPKPSPGPLGARNQNK